ncbi:MAG: GMP/IMP nucleotidase [Chloroflexota bacterium]
MASPRHPPSPAGRPFLPQPFPWQEVDTVLLDMDGTLLDKHFDDFFWEEYVPASFGRQQGLSLPAARTECLARYRRQEGTLAWTDLDFWSQELGLDIPTMKGEIDHLIRILPHVEEFLQHCRRLGRSLYLVTNAHPKTLAIKLGRAPIAEHFDRLVCSTEVGLAKEDQAFWQRLEIMLGFDRRRTLLADDTERVLSAAAAHGIAWLVHIARPSSNRPEQTSALFPSVHSFAEIMP